MERAEPGDSKVSTSARIMGTLNEMELLERANLSFRMLNKN